STTIASSTTMPIERTMPNNVSVLIEKPNSSIAVNVPISDTGTASIGIMVARQFCRNRNTTAKTSAMDSPSVFSTSWIDTRTNLVVSYGTEKSKPGGADLMSSSSLALTASPTS